MDDDNQHTDAIRWLELDDSLSLPSSFQPCQNQIPRENWGLAFSPNCTASNSSLLTDLTTPIWTSDLSYQLSDTPALLVTSHDQSSEDWYRQTLPWDFISEPSSANPSIASLDPTWSNQGCSTEASSVSGNSPVMTHAIESPKNSPRSLAVNTHSDMLSGHTRPRKRSLDLRQQCLLDWSLPTAPKTDRVQKKIRREVQSRLDRIYQGSCLHTATGLESTDPSKDRNKRMFSCTWRCGKRFRTKEQWVEHENLRLPQGIWVCSACRLEGPNRPPSIFFDRAELQRHLKNRHPEVDDDWARLTNVTNTSKYDEVDVRHESRCGWGGYQFKSWKDRMDHLEQHFYGIYTGSDVAKYNHDWPTSDDSTCSRTDELVYALNEQGDNLATTMTAPHLSNEAPRDVTVNMKPWIQTNSDWLGKLSEKAASTGESVATIEEVTACQAAQCLTTQRTSMPNKALLRKQASHEAESPDQDSAWESSSDDGYDTSTTTEAALSPNRDPMLASRISAKRKKQMAERILKAVLTMYGFSKDAAIQAGAGSPPNMADTPRSFTSSLYGASSRDSGGSAVNRNGLNLGMGPPGSSGSQIAEAQRDPSEARQPPRRFACPYFQRDTPRYNTAKYRACSGPGFLDVHRLKGHLYRRHRTHTCMRCSAEFDDEPSLRVHSQLAEPCKTSEKSTDPEGFDHEQEVELRKRKREELGRDEEQKWILAYKILFPHDVDIPSPYYTHNALELAVAEASPDSAAANDFNTFMTGFFPNYLQRQIQAVLETDLVMVEENVLARVIESTRTRVGEVFQLWHSRNASTVGTVNPTPEAWQVTTPTASGTYPGASAIAATRTLSSRMMHTSASAAATPVGLSQEQEQEQMEEAISNFYIPPEQVATNSTPQVPPSLRLPSDTVDSGYNSLRASFPSDVTPSSSDPRFYGSESSTYEEQHSLATDMRTIAKRGADEPIQPSEQSVQKRQRRR